MQETSMLVLTGSDIVTLLQNKEDEITDIIKDAYLVHSRADSSLPHSHFLRFPSNTRDRIIALPGFLGGAYQTAGIKWISSFPNNIQNNLERATAVLILNSVDTGHPMAMLESSVISSKRTAASAALAAHRIGHDRSYDSMGVIGCGLINFEILRFTLSLRPEIKNVFLFDLNRDRAEEFVNKCKKTFANPSYHIQEESTDLFQASNLISFATTAGTPYLNDPSVFLPESILLNVSLRDLSPEIVLAADNVTDDHDHVFRENTSVYLDEQQVKHRDFARCTLADILAEQADPYVKGKMTIFSPFGLGVLDLALGKYVYDEAKKQNQGISIPDFFPQFWQTRD